MTIEASQKIEDNPLYIDNREKNEILVGKIRSFDFKTEITRLTVGDYLWLNKYCVEVKEINDFLSSLEGRIWSQLRDMTISYEHNFLVIHGSNHDLSHHRRKLWYVDSIITGAIARISLDYNINVIKIDTVEMAAHLIKSLYTKTFTKGSDKQKIATRTFSDYRLAVLQGLPLVSSSTSKLLLDKFKTIKNICNADIKDLQKVKGIGKNKAQLIHDVFNSETSMIKQIISKGY